MNKEIPTTPEEDEAFEDLQNLIDARDRFIGKVAVDHEEDCELIDLNTIRALLAIPR